MELSTYCTVDAGSSFVLGMQSNFDERVDPFEINSEAIDCGDLELPEAFRQHGQYWLAGDELGAGRAMARRDERARIDLLPRSRNSMPRPKPEGTWRTSSCRHWTQPM